MTRQRDPVASPADRSGAVHALSWAIERYEPRLRQTAGRILRNPDDTNEAIQEALLAGFVAFGGFRGSALVSTWLHRIVVNVCLMSLRRARRRPLEFHGDLDSLAVPIHGTAAGGYECEPSSHLQRREIEVIVRRCIEALPESYRAVLVLRDLEDLDTEETARRLGVSPTAAKVRLYRARRALRAQLAPFVLEGAL